MFTYVCIGCNKVKLKTKRTYTIIGVDGGKEVAKRYCCPKCTEVLERTYEEHMNNPLRGSYD